MIKEITPPDAWTILRSDPNAVLLDVRSTMEFQYVGHPIGAVHVPLKEPPDWNVNPDFVDSVRRALSEKSAGAGGPEGMTILSICRSGQRSHTAAELLAAQGFNNVYNVIEGFEGDRDKQSHRNTINGWRVHGLPWEQS